MGYCKLYNCELLVAKDTWKSYDNLLISDVHRLINKYFEDRGIDFTISYNTIQNLGTSGRHKNILLSKMIRLTKVDLKKPQSI
jgi:hypothetical protein